MNWYNSAVLLHWVLHAGLVAVILELFRRYTDEIKERAVSAEQNAILQERTREALSRQTQFGMEIIPLLRDVPAIKDLLTEVKAALKEAGRASGTVGN